jgi:hypothetical protein
MNEERLATHLITLLSKEEDISGIRAVGTEDNEFAYTVTVHVLSLSKRNFILDKVLAAIDTLKADMSTLPLEITVQLSLDGDV